MFCFGPSGRNEDFYNKYKGASEIPKWLNENGLDAYEYPFTKVLNISQKKAEEMGEEVKKNNIKLSLHGPYSISLSHPDEEIRSKSVQDIFKSMLYCQWMGADRVVFHPGSISDEGKDADLIRVRQSMELILDNYYKFNFKGIFLCPEVMGKANHLGTIDEIISLSKMAPEIIPTFDFAHIHARYRGLFKEDEDYRKVVDFIVNNLSKDKLNKLHIHFTRVEYGINGEKRHRSYHEKAYGPDFEPLAKLLVEYKLSGRVINESRGTMLEDAITLRSIYEKYKKLSIKK
ncbi:TIM barrel protein [Alkalibaculum sp. M08DMB]|uniref:TIM barrel protein n=1 Tax=Alkalibaculum sporogenes TaxID=2655001 RepID=A0A6A7K7P2_9FIRM|nr:TIM barrel protein [Alkalibaculum sporogenes]MPW25133.1 TIM barrel protein [Alkalibaculum sporogenes]